MPSINHIYLYQQNHLLNIFNDAFTACRVEVTLLHSFHSHKNYFKLDFNNDVFLFLQNLTFKTLHPFIFTKVKLTELKSALVSSKPI